jgi:hypothetical protein
MWSFRMAAARWVFTVFKQIFRMRAISFVRPSATRLTIARVPVTKSLFFPHRCRALLGVQLALERQFKQPPPIFIGDDNHSTAERRSVPSVTQTLLCAA